MELTEKNSRGNAKGDIKEVSKVTSTRSLKKHFKSVSVLLLGGM